MAYTIYNTNCKIHGHYHSCCNDIKANCRKCEFRKKQLDAMVNTFISDDAPEWIKRQIRVYFDTQKIAPYDIVITKDEVK